MQLLFLQLLVSSQILEQCQQGPCSCSEQRVALAGHSLPTLCPVCGAVGSWAGRTWVTGRQWLWPSPAVWPRGWYWPSLSSCFFTCETGWEDFQDPEEADIAKPTSSPLTFFLLHPCMILFRPEVCGKLIVFIAHMGTRQRVWNEDERWSSVKNSILCHCLLLHMGACVRFISIQASIPSKS